MGDNSVDNNKNFQSPRFVAKPYLNVALNVIIIDFYTSTGSMILFYNGRCNCMSSRKDKSPSSQAQGKVA